MAVVNGQTKLVKEYLSNPASKMEVDLSKVEISGSKQSLLFLTFLNCADNPPGLLLQRKDATDNAKHMGLLLLTPAKKENASQLIYNIDYVEGFTSKTNKLLYQGIVIDIKELYQRIVFIYI